MPVTRDDVARVAGVSVATVSYVLNAGPKPVSNEKRQRVLDAVASLGYRPNAIARSLRARRTRILGLVLPDSANAYFARLARALEDAAGAHGYQVVVSNAGEDRAREAAQIEALLSLQVDGLLWVPADRGDSGDERAGPIPSIPTVQVDRVSRVPVQDDSGFTGAVIEADNRQGGRIAAEHLISLGHPRVAFLSGTAGHAHTELRLAGAREAFSAAGLRGPALVGHGDFTHEAGYEQVRSWWQLAAAERPTAIQCANDAMAIGVLHALAELGARVPQDVSVTGYDDVPQARFSVPSLTTVAQPIDAMAQAAMDRLLEQIGAAPGTAALPARGGAGRRVFPVTLVVRRSTAPEPGSPGRGTHRLRT